MTTILFATNNKNKIAEVQTIVPINYTIVSLAAANIQEDIPEPWPTIEENAVHKATYISNKYNCNCFSEDTGLVVPLLNGAPGVKSARYAGDAASALDNIALLLHNLKDQTPTPAYFKTVICLILNGEQHLFTGICEGTIIATPTGEQGFGYDPIFIPTGANNTFATMDMAGKNKYSHRKKAMQQLITFLEDIK